MQKPKALGELHVSTMILHQNIVPRISFDGEIAIRQFPIAGLLVVASDSTPVRSVHDALASLSADVVLHSSSPADVPATVSAISQVGWY
jgi:hypothetical protein